MIYLNPTKPFYHNKEKRYIRMGNFSNTGKEIEYEGESFAKLVALLQKPIEKQVLIENIVNEFSLPFNEVEEVVDYLLAEGFIVEYNDIKKIMDDEMYNRENLYFYMLSDGNVYSLGDYKNKRIAILGAGGIGACSCELLVRAGFKNFSIFDFDNVEKSNLIRQIAYEESDIGKLKVESLRDNMYKIANDLRIETFNKKIITESDIEKDIQDADFVLCTLDKPVRVIRRLINSVCVKNKKPVLFCGFAEHVGMIGPFVLPNKTACLECIEKEMEDIPLNNVSEAPSFGPLCTLIASVATSEIINYFIDFKKANLQGSTLMFNMYDYSIERKDWNKDSKCKGCGDSED